MSKHSENELAPELMGVNALNPWSRHNSSPRGAMFGGHIGQALVVEGAEPRHCLSGLEREYGKYTFNIEMPTDAQIIKVIERYPRTYSADTIKENPETVVIYEDVHTKEVGIVTLSRHFSMDKQFGFKYKYNHSALNQLDRGNYVPKGTVLADSPNVQQGSEYAYGVEANTVFMSVPAVIEDGVVARAGFLEKLKTNVFESRVASWGRKHYPVNLYGDADNYKPFPDIGDRVRDDGLVMALRRYDDYLCVTDMTPEATMEPDIYYDVLYYGRPGARVSDVIVHHDINAQRHPTPVGMETQTEKYRKAISDFYSQLINVYVGLKKERGEGLKITPEFHRLLVEAYSDEARVHNTRTGKKEKVTRTHRRDPIDDWRVEVHYEFTITPGIGFKITDLNGGGHRVTD